MGKVIIRISGLFAPLRSDGGGHIPVLAIFTIIQVREKSEMKKIFVWW